MIVILDMFENLFVKEWWTCFSQAVPALKKAEETAVVGGVGVGG